MKSMKLYQSFHHQEWKRIDLTDWNFVDLFCTYSDLVFKVLNKSVIYLCISEFLFMRSAINIIFIINLFYTINCKNKALITSMSDSLSQKDYLYHLSEIKIVFAIINWD